MHPFNPFPLLPPGDMRHQSLASLEFKHNMDALRMKEHEQRRQHESRRENYEGQKSMEALRRMSRADSNDNHSIGNDNSDDDDDDNIQIDNGMSSDSDDGNSHIDGLPLTADLSTHLLAVPSSRRTDPTKNARMIRMSDTSELRRHGS